MANEITATAVYLMPGMSIKLKSPIGIKNANGFYADTGSAPASFFPNKNADQLALTRGFIVEDDNVGAIEATTEQELSVIYRHKKPASNAVWFFSLTEEKAIINIITVPIHDHSTIVQGGPAYGTYFDDDVER